MLIEAGRDFFELPAISALLMTLGARATLGDVTRLRARMRRRVRR